MKGKGGGYAVVCSFNGGIIRPDRICSSLFNHLCIYWLKGGEIAVSPLKKKKEILHRSQVAVSRPGKPRG